MATLRKRGSHQWQAIVRKSGFPRYSATFKTKTEAKTWADKIEESMANDTFKGILQADVTTLKEVMDRYLVDVVPQKKALDTEIRTFHRVVRHLDAVSLLNKPIGRITPNDIAGYIDHREQTVGPRTVCIELALISHVYTKARKKYRIRVDNPVSDIEKPKAARGRNRRCTKKEEQLLINAASDFGKYGEMNIIIPFAIETAMRRGEIASLLWEHVDFDDRTAYLPDTKNGDPRTVPLSPRAVDLLKRLPFKEYGKVFTYQRDPITRAFCSVKKIAGIANLRFHDLRHEATSRLFEKGLGAADVKLT